MRLKHLSFARLKLGAFSAAVVAVVAVVARLVYQAALTQREKT
jgi:hypothetical protein